MNIMNTPGFTAEASLYTKNGYLVARTSEALDAPPCEDKVVPQQFESCRDINGPCVDPWPRGHGTQCVTGFSGAQQCCTTVGTWPYIRECSIPGGGWRVDVQGCYGPCD